MSLSNANITRVMFEGSACGANSALMRASIAQAEQKGADFGYQRRDWTVDPAGDRGHCRCRGVVRLSARRRLGVQNHGSAASAISDVSDEIDCRIVNGVVKDESSATGLTAQTLLLVKSA